MCEVESEAIVVAIVVVKNQQWFHFFSCCTDIIVKGNITCIFYLFSPKPSRPVESRNLMDEILFPNFGKQEFLSFPFFLSLSLVILPLTKCNYTGTTGSINTFFSPSLHQYPFTFTLPRSSCKYSVIIIENIVCTSSPSLYVSLLRAREPN